MGILFFHGRQPVPVYLRWQTVKDVFKKILHSLVDNLALVYVFDVGLRCAQCPH